jgi:hypothetical protein
MLSSRSAADADSIGMAGFWSKFWTAVLIGPLA